MSDSKLDFITGNANSKLQKKCVSHCFYSLLPQLLITFYAVLEHESRAVIEEC